eukprot:scaffold58648_cov24-Tisochrysis_lutea.AAC.1
MAPSSTLATEPQEQQSPIRPRRLRPSVPVAVSFAPLALTVLRRSIDSRDRRGEPRQWSSSVRCCSADAASDRACSLSRHRPAPRKAVRSARFFRTDGVSSAPLESSVLRRPLLTSTVSSSKCTHGASSPVASSGLCVTSSIHSLSCCLEWHRISSPSPVTGVSCSVLLARLTWTAAPSRRAQRRRWPSFLTTRQRAPPTLSSESERGRKRRAPVSRTKAMPPALGKGEGSREALEPI